MASIKQLLKDIPMTNRIVDISPLHSNWKNKYKLSMDNGSNEILELYNSSEYDSVMNKIFWVQYLEKKDFPTNHIINHGWCHKKENYYLRLSYIEGECLENLLSEADERAQIDYGRFAGKMLRKIHCLHSPLPNTITVDERIRGMFLFYEKETEICKAYPASEMCEQFLRKHLHWFDNNKEQTLLHGDFHAGNLVLKGDQIYAIDWSYGKRGNPTEDFVRNIVNATMSDVFAKSLVLSYFDAIVPEAFWQELVVFTSLHAIELVSLHNRYPQVFTDSFVSEQHRLIIDQYNGFNSIIPKYVN